MPEPTAEETVPNSPAEADEEPAQQLVPLSPEQIEAASRFFANRLVGQPEVVRTLTDVLYRQTALLKRLLEQPEQAGVVPRDPTVLLFAGGAWGKTLAARLIPHALAPLGFAPFAALTPLPQDLEGTLDLDQSIFTIPYTVVLVEHLEDAAAINARFIANLGRLLESGVYPLMDPATKAVHAIPLGLTTFIFTTTAGEEEIQRALQADGKLGFLRNPSVTSQEAYEAVQRIVRRALAILPEEIMRHVDETVIFRPLSNGDLRRIFEAEVEFYEHSAFPGKALRLEIEPAAGDFLFSQALDGLEVYGIRALRRTVQRNVDPPLYRAYVAGQLSEEALERLAVHVGLVNGEVRVELRERAS
jgi:ATP-dependent Clp protease ATP-binding subunit ClpA